MHAVIAAGASFLSAVLWFDLMFDVQVLGSNGATLSPGKLSSIAAYYRRVTTDATPMNRLVALVMVITLASLLATVLRSDRSLWADVVSLVCAASAVGLAAARTVRNAVRLGSGKDGIEQQSRLARAIYRDHLFCLCAMAPVVGIQIFLAAAPLA